ncbi:MAG: BON domain-containing protein [Wenzhouxiangellaceae bacterium]|nr:BON domain-containing protein [Wenzhouxiangellaceae bacterium]
MRSMRMIQGLLVMVFATFLAACVVHPVDDPYDDDIDHRILEEVHQAFEIHDAIHEESIEIRVDDRVVYLSGVVGSHEEAALADDVASDVDGVIEVRSSDLRVVD